MSQITRGDDPTPGSGDMLLELPQHMLDLLLEGCQVIGFDWRYRYVSATASVHARKARNELIGRTMMEVYPGIDQTPMFEALSRTMTRRTQVRLENRFVYPDGEEAWFDLRFLPVPEGVLVLSLDITEQKQAEEALRRSEQKYRELFDHAQVGMFRLSADGQRLLDANPKLSEILGAPAGELQAEGSGLPWAHPERFADFLAQVLSGGKIDHVELELITHDGRRIPCIVSAAALPNGSGVEGTVRDITRRVRDEQHRLKLVAAIDQAAEAVVVTDSTGRISYVNPAFEKISGYTRDEVIGRNPRFLKSGAQDEEFFRKMWEELASNGYWRGRLLNRRKDGTQYTQDSTISRVTDNGTLIGYVAVNRDVTAELEMEAQLSHAQRMETIGRLTGGIAHDFNNLLAVILGSTEFALAEMAEGSPERESLEEIRAAGERAAALTRQLLAFGRREPVHVEEVEISGILARMEPMIRRLVPSDIAVTVHNLAHQCTVFADPAQLDQLLMNLVVNARDAMPKGGRLTISLQTAELDEGSLGPGQRVKPGHYAQLTVSDTGVGMDEATRNRAFEPFFTTKEVGSGTGLGLATVYGIVNQLDGHIWLSSEIGVGTTFKCYIPCHQGETVASVAADDPVEADGGGKLVIVVEDEPAVLAIIRRVLLQAGYRVIGVGSVLEAEREFARNSTEVALVISDVVMPDGGGLTLIEHLHTVHPELPVLLMSGYADDALVNRGIDSSQVDILGKPFSAAELRRRVRALINAR